MFSSEWATLWTALAAAAATITAVMAAAYTYFTLRLVRAQAEPKVIVYVKHDRDRPTLLTVVIENIGRDIAHDVTFTASRPIPTGAYGIAPEDAKDAKAMTEGPLVSGIPALGPGDSRVINWGQYGGLSKAIGGNPIVLDYAYYHEGRRITGKAKLEVQSYVGTDASETPALGIAKSLKDIATDIGRFSRSFEFIAAMEREKARKPDRKWPNPRMHRDARKSGARG